MDKPRTKKKTTKKTKKKKKVWRALTNPKRSLGWKKMLGSNMPAVLADIDDDGSLRPESTLQPRFPFARGGSRTLPRATSFDRIRILARDA